MNLLSTDKSLPMTDPLETRVSLIRRLPNASDAAAWDEFVKLYSPLVYRIARRQGLQPADADDLLQEVLSSVSTSVDEWLHRSDRGAFRPWLRRIARNTTINFLTRRRHRPLGIGGSDAQRRLIEASDNDDAVADFDREYQHELFRQASAHVRIVVTEPTWQAFEQTTLHDRPVADVANDLGMTPGSVYIARSRVMARLRTFVRQHEEQER